jgi:hypothetical protein
MSELDSIIEDSLNDLDDFGGDETPDTPTPDVETAQAETPDDTQEQQADVKAESTDQAKTEAQPETQDPSITSPEDEFAKRHGLQSHSVTGRENRIPYSRVKAIVGKVEAALKKAQEDHKVTQPKLQEFETKVKGYEDRLQQIAQFEYVMENDPRTFMDMLSQLPAYKPFFDKLTELVQTVQGQPKPGAQTQEAKPDQPYLDQSDMPQPDLPLADGSRAYSLQGLAKRDEWLAKQIEERAVRQAEERLTKRYGPIEERWKQQAYYEQVSPIIDKQIAEARTWPHFDELEQDVVGLLNADKTKRMTLEGAYMKAYHAKITPRVTADRNKVRTEVLDELRRTPQSTAAPARPRVPNARPQAPAGSDKASLEALIAEEVAKLTGGM